VNSNLVNTDITFRSKTRWIADRRKSVWGDGQRFCQSTCLHISMFNYIWRTIYRKDRLLDISSYKRTW